MLLPISLSRPAKGRKAVEVRTAHVRRLRVGAFLSAVQLEDRLAMAVSTWSGAVSGLWSDAGNWDVAPNPGDNLVFPLGASNLITVNDLSAGISYASIALDGPGYSLSGNALTVETALTTFYAVGTAQIDLDMTFSDATPGIAVVFPDASLQFVRPITTANPISKSGSGSLVLNSLQSYTADTLVNSGLLVVNESMSGRVVLSPSTVLSGVGSTTAVDATGATVQPGIGALGTLTVAGEFSLDTDSTFVVGLGDPNENSAVRSGGPVALGSAELTVNLGYVPVGADVFTILDNTGSDPIDGTFDGLPEGSLVDVGGQKFKISYVGGTGNDITLTHQITTTTELTSNVNPSVYGQSVTLVASVTAAAGTATGAVKFYAGPLLLSTVPLNASGQATYVTSALPVGTHQLIAVYEGAGNYLTSTSTDVNQVVTQAETLSTLVGAPNPSQLSGSVTLTATVVAKTPGSGVPGGSVRFFNDGVLIGVGTLNASGVAELVVTGLPLGSNPLTAVYDGDSEYTGSTSPSYPLVVNKNTTTTSVTSSANPSNPGATVTFTATVSAAVSSFGVPTGSVSFFDGAVLLATVGLDATGKATFDATSLTIGSHAITVQYLGDDDFATSTSAVLNQVVNKVATTTTLTAAPNPSTFGDPVTFTATVTPNASGFGAVTGSVQFLNGTTVIGTAAVNSSGIATLTVSNLAIGANSITAAYQGDSQYVASTSTAVSQVVNKAASTVTLTSTADQITAAGMVTFTAKVGASNPNLTTVPTGQVRFIVNGVVLATRTLANGEATFTTNGFGLGLGVDEVTAEYVGDTNFNGAESSAVTVVAGTENERWLNQVYLQVMFRPIDYQALAKWTDRLQRGSSRACVVTRIRNTPEGRQMLVQQSFIEYLGREGTPDEIRMTMGAAQRTRTSPRAIILGTPEFYDEIGDGTPEGYVGALEAVLGTTFSPRASAMIVHKLNAGEPPFKVAEHVLTSRTGRTALIQQMYQQVLGREATERELAGFLWQQTRNVYWRQQQSYLLASEEFYLAAIEEPGFVPEDF